MEMRHGYKRTEAGVTPQDWDVVLIGELFSFKNGLNKAKTYFGYGTPIVNYMDVFNRPVLRIENIVGRVNVSSKELAAYEVRKGDVFFTRTSETVDEIGVASVMLDQPERTVFSGFVLRARPCDDSLDDTFKAYCFASRNFRQQVTSRASYTTRALTNGRTLSAALLARPPLAEQRTIAAALNDVDALLDGLDRFIAKKRDLKQAVTQQLLTGQIRLPGFHGEWETKRVGVIGTTYGGLTGKTKADFGVGNARYITFLNVLENVVIDPHQCELVRVGPGERQNPVRKGDILFNGTSETPGDLAMAGVTQKDENNLFLNSFCFGFRVHAASEHLPLFLAYYFRGTPGRHIMRTLAQGATRYNMSKSQFKALALSLPQHDEQKAIATALCDMDAEIAALESRRNKTRDLKKAMMQELLTGKTRLVQPEVAHA